MAQRRYAATFRRWFGDSRVVVARGEPLLVYHGRTGDFAAFNTMGARGKTHGTGAFFSSSPAVANAYAGGVDGGNVVSAYLALRAPVQVDGGGRHWNRLDKHVRVRLPAIEVPDDDEELAAALEDRAPRPGATKRLQARITTLGAHFPGELVYSDDYASTDDLARWARQRGHDGLIIRNVIDCGPSGIHFTDAAREPADLFVAFNPWQIKSALGNSGAFDPHDPDITDSAARVRGLAPKLGCAPAVAAKRANVRAPETMEMSL